jgi:hypothetical protein
MNGDFQVGKDITTQWKAFLPNVFPLTASSTHFPVPPVPGYVPGGLGLHENLSL